MSCPIVVIYNVPDDIANRPIWGRAGSDDVIVVEPGRMSFLFFIVTITAKITISEQVIKTVQILLSVK